MMRKILTVLAATVLLTAGCSKEELTDNVAEDVSSIATPSNGHARFGNPDATPEVWFNQDNGRMLLRVPPRWTHVALTATAKNYSLNGNEDPNDGTFVDEDGDGVFDYQQWSAELNQVGNSRIYRSGGGQFVFGQTVYFSLVDVTINANSFVEEWEGESTSLQLFLYPSGRTVEQAPKAVLRRFHVKESINGEWDEAITAELTITIADDPAQEVAQMKFVPDPIYPYPDDPTYAIYLEPIYLEKTHENQALGMSRWIGTKTYPREDSYNGVLYSLDNNGNSVITPMSWGQVLD